MRQIEFLSCQTETNLGSFVSSRMKENLDHFYDYDFYELIMIYSYDLYNLCETNNFLCVYKGFKILFGVKVNLFSKR